MKYRGGIVLKKLISFSGIDGSGKTTQINNLVKMYEKEKLKCIFYTELPKTEPFDEDCYLHDYYKKLVDYDVMVLRSCYRTKEHVEYLKFIKNESHEIKDTYKLQEYFVKDTYMWFKEVIFPLINRDKIIIFDRYVYDELPYQMLFNKDVELIKRLIKILPEPKSFYMKIDVNTMKQRNLNREDSKNKLFSSDEKIQRIIDNYNSVFDEINCIQIDATLNSSDISLKVAGNLYKKTVREELKHNGERERG